MLKLNWKEINLEKNIYEVRIKWMFGDADEYRTNKIQFKDEKSLVKFVEFMEKYRLWEYDLSSMYREDNPYDKDCYDFYEDQDRNSYDFYNNFEKIEKELTNINFIDEHFQLKDEFSPMSEMCGSGSIDIISVFKQVNGKLFKIDNIFKDKK